jgi:hypothetical protein
MDSTYEMDYNTKEEFSNNVKSYLELEMEISKINVALKERRTKLKVLSEMIMRNMNNNDIQHVNIKNGVLVYKSEEKFKPLNKTTLKTGLSIIFNNDEDKVDGATQIVMNNRGKVLRTKLQLKKF